MNIVIVGCGNVGKTLTEQLSREGHNIVIIDTKPNLVTSISNMYDVLGVVGNGASYSVQKDAGIEDADLLIAVAGSDELNLLCCLIAKKAGNCQTIARVGNPVYSKETEFIRKELGLSMIVNPELAAASEIARLIKFPSAMEVDAFAKGKIELMKLKITAESKFNHCSLRDISLKIGNDILICAVQRGEEVYIPNGNFVLEEKDLISIVTSSQRVLPFLKKMNLKGGRVKSTLIVGGGETIVYLADQLLSMGIQVKIIEMSRTRCEELCELVPKASIICGDGTDRDLLLEEGIGEVDSFIAWTNFDEENIMISLYAKSMTKAKIVAQVHRTNYDKIVENLEIGSVMYPKNITSEYIIRYVRAMQNSIGSNVETLYRLIENKVEALEFIVRDDAAAIIDKPLHELNLKNDLLICSINHNGNIITPRGQDIIRKGDSVVVVTTTTGLRDLNDILK